MHLAGVKIPFSEHIAVFELSGCHPCSHTVVPSSAIPSNPGNSALGSGGGHTAASVKNISAIKKQCNRE